MSSNQLPRIQITHAEKKHAVFSLPESLAKKLQEEGIALKIGKGLKTENLKALGSISIKDKQRGHEIIFYDKENNHLTLDEVVNRVTKGNRLNKEATLAFRANLVHALLQHFECEVNNLNGAFSTSLIETIGVNDREKSFSRYFIASNLERVNPEEYSGRGCAEANVNLAARERYKGEYHINELHLRCYFKDENGHPKIEHGKQCLCGVCRDICHEHWTKGAPVYLHPINPDNTYLMLEQEKQFNVLDQEKISCVSSRHLMPELTAEISNQKAAKEAFDSFEEELTRLGLSNEPHSRSGLAALTRKAQNLEWELKDMFENAPPESRQNIDVLTLGDGVFLEKLNQLMVVRLKEAVYAHLIMASEKELEISDYYPFIPEKIEVMAGFNPILNNIELVASCNGKYLSALPTASAALGLANNTKGFTELAYMKFDKEDFRYRVDHPNESKLFAYELPHGNFMERANKQKGYTAVERSLTQSHKPSESEEKIQAQETKQRWTIFPLNDGTLGADELRKVMHQTTIERVLPGGWAGAKATMDQGRS